MFGRVSNRNAEGISRRKAYRTEGISFFRDVEGVAHKNYELRYELQISGDSPVRGNVEPARQKGLAPTPRAADGNYNGMSEKSTTPSKWNEP